VEIMQGKLKSVTIGKAHVDDVAVSFIDNDQLRSSGLLGMSFLGRFQVTFDDADNRITLKPYQ
jgi:Predicted aspartyl protease